MGKGHRAPAHSFRCGEPDEYSEVESGEERNKSGKMESGMKRRIIAGLVLLFGAYAAQAKTTSSANHGNWTNSATWNNGVPSTGDVVYVQSHSVTSSTPALGPLNVLATLQPTGHMVMLDGSEIDVTSGDVVLNLGMMTVGTGAVFTQTGTGYLKIGRDAGKDGTLVIDGGTYNSDRAIFMNLGNSGNAKATMIVNDGLMNCTKQIIFGGSTDSEARLFVNGGTAQFNWIDFDQGANPGGGTQLGEITVDGGDLILTTGNEAGSIAFAGDYNKVFYESGSITWRGVDSQPEFDAFVTIFNGWVDSTNITSVAHTAAELKSMLQFVGSDAFLAAPGTVLPSLRQKSIASGAWASDSTWDTGFAPRDGDGVWILDDDVTASGVMISLESLALLNAQQGTLTLSDGSDFDVFGSLPIMDGELAIESGSSLSVFKGGENYIQVGRDAGTTGALTIDGGTFYTERAMFNTLWNSPNATGTITVANGSLLSPDWQIIFGGASNSVSTMEINAGGTVECLFINFDQVDGNPAQNGNGTQYEEVTVNGGDLILNTDDYTNAVQFAGSYSKLFFEGGSITIKGVNTPEDFSNYVPLFNGAVDAQYVDSVTYTDEELKAMLQYSYLGDAVVTTEELKPYGYMTITIDGDTANITSSSLYPQGTNTLQVKTDLVGGSWSSLSSSTGVTSNTWVITPLTDTEAFYQIIAE
jgi:hypothetical protein